MVRDYGVDWKALLPKTEEKIAKLEEFYGPNQPMEGIEEMRGVEHAYYDKMLEEAEKMLGEADRQTRLPKGMQHTIKRMGGPEDWTPESEINKDEAASGNLKQALFNAFDDAADLVNGLEEFMEKADELDMKNIDSALETVSRIKEMLDIAKGEFVSTEAVEEVVEKGEA